MANSEQQNQPADEQLGFFEKIWMILWALIFFVGLIVLIFVNLYFSNTFGETCGILHPSIFEVQASIIDDNGRLITADYTQFPQNEADIITFFSLASDFNIAPDSNEVAAELDTYLRIYDESGEILLASNDDSVSGETYSSSIESFGLPEDAVIIVEVGTFNDSEEGSFTLSVQPVEGDIMPIDPIEVEPFDSVYTETDDLNNAGDSVTDFVFIDERVQYRMQVVADQAYNFTVSGAADLGLIQESELDTYLRVYDSSGSILLDENDDEITGEIFSSFLPNFGVEDEQTVIIEIGTFEDSLAGDYVLEVIPIPGDYFFDSIEPEPTEAEIVSEGIQIGTDGASLEGYVDVSQRVRYEFTPESGQAYEIVLYGVNAFSTDTGAATSDFQRIPDYYTLHHLSTDPNAANEWTQCLQFYGFVSDSGYVINLNGFIWFLSGTEAEDKLADSCTIAADATTRDFLQQCVQANLHLSTSGRVYFFMLLAILVVLFPILIVDSLEGFPEQVWYLFLILVALEATTTAMLFLHLGEVSGIAALEEFGYGIFAGITTASAIAFIDKVASETQDGRPPIFPTGVFPWGRNRRRRRNSD